MNTEHQTTREEEAYCRLLEEAKSEFSEAAGIFIRKAQLAAYAMNMVRSYCFQPEEYDEAMENMRLAATQLTGRESELLATLWRAALAAAASIDADDFDVLVGHKVYRGDLHYYYRMVSLMVERTLEEKELAELRKESEEQGPVDLPDPPF
jgi:hypothetical protein